MNESLNNSSHSSSFVASNETLDQVFKDQLLALRQEILKIPHALQIELCYKWLNVFSKCSESEKLARNCLCLLMQQQLQVLQGLEFPFTDLSNCNRNLDLLLNDIDMQASTATHNSDHAMSKLCSEITHLKIEQEEQPLLTENQLLRNEVSDLRKKLEKLQAEQLRERDENLKNCQQIYRNLIINLHKSMTVNWKTEYAHCFSNIFVPLLENNHINDAHLIHKLCECDQIFENLLQQKCKYKQKLAQGTKKIEEKYKRRFNRYNYALFLQMKIIQLKLHSKIRRTCQEMKQCNDPIFIRQMLDDMEFKCETILNKFL